MKESTIVQKFAETERRLNMLATHIQTIAFAIESLARESQVMNRYIMEQAKTEEEKVAIASKLDEIRKKIQEEMVEKVKENSQVRKMAKEMKDNASAAETNQVSTSKAEEKPEAKA